MADNMSDTEGSDERFEEHVAYLMKDGLSRELAELILNARCTFDFTQDNGDGNLS